MKLSHLPFEEDHDHIVFREAVSFGRQGETQYVEGKKVVQHGQARRPMTPDRRRAKASREHNFVADVEARRVHDRNVDDAKCSFEELVRNILR